MPRTRMSSIPRSLYICPTRLAVFLLGRKDLRALGALRIDDNQAFTTANPALFGADENLASHRSPRAPNDMRSKVRWTRRSIEGLDSGGIWRNRISGKRRVFPQ